MPRILNVTWVPSSIDRRQFNSVILALWLRKSKLRQSRQRDDFYQACRQGGCLCPFISHESRCEATISGMGVRFHERVPFAERECYSQMQVPSWLLAAQIGSRKSSSSGHHLLGIFLLYKVCPMCPIRLYHPLSDQSDKLRNSSYTDRDSNIAISHHRPI